MIDIPKDILRELMNTNSVIIICLPLERLRIIPLETIHANDQSFDTRGLSCSKVVVLLACSPLVYNILGHQEFKAY